MAAALTACEGTVAIISPGAPAPLVRTPFSASFQRVLVPQIVVVSGSRRVTPSFDIAIVASEFVDVQRVTIRMLDGSSLGGPMVTFGAPQLVPEFGATRVAPGATSVFGVRPAFVWTNSWGPPRSIAADIVSVDDRGRMHSVTIQSAWP
jgi:hypothetical protein